MEPASPSDEAKSKVEAIVLRQLEVLNKIVDIALAADAKACKQETKLGSKYLECSKAICAIRELCGPYLAKNLQGGEGVPPSQRKPTMDFGSFHVTRAAVKGRTVLTFNRKADPENPGQSRQIVATITRYNGGVSITITDYMEGVHPIPTKMAMCDFYNVSLSKCEKIAYSIVRKNIKETKRRHITLKRSRAAKRKAAAQKEVK